MKDPPAVSGASISSGLDRVAGAVPPHAWFGVSAVSRYLGPALAVLVFPAVGVLGIAWFRIATAAFVFAPLTRPWRTLRDADGPTRLLLVGLGVCLAAMNTAFYLALDRLPMRLVAAMEFVATIGVGLVSSVIPYACDQLAMARLPRASFALLLALLPATATVIAAVVLAQLPSPPDVLGIALVMTGIAIHRPTVK